MIQAEILRAEVSFLLEDIAFTIIAGYHRPCLIISKAVIICFSFSIISFQIYVILVLSTSKRQQCD